MTASSRAFLCGIILLADVALLPAAVEPVSISLPKAKAYVGQRLSFFVELRSKGSFGGATSFQTPEVLGAIVVKIGDATVSSEKIEGETWFIQSHEFAIFSQKSGKLEVPKFPVHFGTREEFTGPVSEQEGEVPSISAEIERPPGTDPRRFLVTTESLSVEEHWEPRPDGNVKVGAIFKRTITQRADNMTGMALAPAPTAVPDGIRVYSGNPDISDKTERGEFSGQRTETLTYLVERPGAYTLPSIRYDWWNPSTKQLESKSLPALTFAAKAPPTADTESVSNEKLKWIGGLVVLGILALAWNWRGILGRLFSRFCNVIDPPERRAARLFIRACRHNDAASAERRLSAWERLHPDFRPDGELLEKIIELRRHLYGKDANPKTWNGYSLASAFHLRLSQTSSERPVAVLPLLNP